MTVKLFKNKDIFETYGIPLQVFRWHLEGDSKRLHAHEFHELIITLSGSGYHFIGNEKTQIKPGDIFLISPGISHYFKSVSNLSIYNVLYVANAIDFPQADLQSIPGYRVLFEFEPKLREQRGIKPTLNLQNESFQNVVNQVKKIENEVNMRQPGFKSMAIIGLMELFCMISRSYTISDNNPSQSLLKLEKVVNYINKHYSENITLKQLCGIAAMSETALLQKFKITLGTTPIKFMIQVRIQKAAQQLLEHKSSISQVAFENGFEDSNYFSRCFKKNIGCSPREYSQLSK